MQLGLEQGGGGGAGAVQQEVQDNGREAQPCMTLSESLCKMLICRTFSILW